MEKKNYVIPAITVVELENVQQIMAASIPNLLMDYDDTLSDEDEIG